MAMVLHLFKYLQMSADGFGKPGGRGGGGGGVVQKWEKSCKMWEFVLAAKKNFRLVSIILWKHFSFQLGQTTNQYYKKIK